MGALAILGFTVLALYVGRVTQSWFFGLASLLCPPVLLSLRYTHTMAVAAMAVFWAFVLFGIGENVAGTAVGFFFGATGGALGVAVNIAFAGIKAPFSASWDSPYPRAQRLGVVKDPDDKLRLAFRTKLEVKSSKSIYTAFVGLIAFVVFAITLFATAYRLSTFDVAKQNTASVELSRGGQSDLNDQSRELDEIRHQLEIAKAYNDFSTAIKNGGTVREWQAASNTKKIIWAESWANTVFESQGKEISETNARLLGLKIATCVDTELQELPITHHIKAAEIGAMCIKKLLV